MFLSNKNNYEWISMEEPLFTIKSKNTRDEFIRFNRVILNKEYHYIRNMNSQYRIGIDRSMFFIDRKGRDITDDSFLLPLL